VSVGASPTQTLTALGTGTLEGSRGDQHVGVVCPGDTTPTLITGEQDATCQHWDSETWASETWTSETWASETWASETWASETWASETWASETWASETWASETWATQSWDAAPSGT
jgi:hypothetical protein